MKTFAPVPVKWDSLLFWSSMLIPFAGMQNFSSKKDGWANRSYLSLVYTSQASDLPLSRRQLAMSCWPLHGNNQVAFNHQECTVPCQKVRWSTTYFDWLAAVSQKFEKWQKHFTHPIHTHAHWRTWTETCWNASPLQTTGMFDSSLLNALLHKRKMSWNTTIELQLLHQKDEDLIGKISR